MPQTPEEITQLLFAWSDGDPDALAALMPAVCDELRLRARRYLDKEKNIHSMESFELVNEVYLRLHKCKTVTWKNRAHFFGFAAETMQRVLVDYSRKRDRAKRNNGSRPDPIDTILDKISSRNVDLEHLNIALQRLEALSQRQAQTVRLRFIVGLTVEEIAAALDVAPVTVKRDWSVAKRFLRRELGGSSDLRDPRPDPTAATPRTWSP